MKKNKVTRMLALLLGCTMALSVTACGDSSAKGSSGEKEEVRKSSEQSSEQNQEQSGEEELEPITLTFGTHSTYWGRGGGIFTDEEPVFQWIKDELGIEIEFVTFDNEKFSLMAAGGDIPDICVAWSQDGLEELIAAGNVVALDSLLDEYGQDIMQKAPIGMASIKYRYGNNETYYGIPLNASTAGDVPISNGYETYLVRYDIWKAIGSPEYSTVDELIDVLVEMQEYVRKETGDDTYYGMTAYLKDGTWGFGCGLAAMGYMWGTIEGALNLQTAEMELDFGSADAPWWTVVECVNKAYRAGVLDPESLTQDQGTFFQKLITGKGLSGFATYTDCNTELAGEEAFLATLPYEPFNAVRAVYGNNVPGGYGCYVISADCEYPERAMQLLNLLWSDEGCRAIYNGVPGVHWDYDEDGVPVFIGDLAAAYEESFSLGSSERNKVSLADNNPVWWSGGDSLASLDGQAINIEKSEQYLEQGNLPGETIFAQDYGFSYPAQVYDKWINEGILKTDKDPRAATTYSLLRANTDEENDLFNAGYNYWMANLTSVVLAKTDAEYEAAKASILENLEALDWGEWTAIWEDMYEEAKGIYASMMEE